MHISSYRFVDSWIHSEKLDIYCGPNTDGVCGCKQDERIKHESLQHGLHKTQHSVNYVVYEELAHRVGGPT